MSYKYSVGEHVMYNGICTVEDIRTEKFGKGEATLFYVLCSLTEPFCRTYVPVGSALEDNIRRLLSPEEIREHIMATENSDLAWISDPKERSAAFSALLSDGDPRKHLWLFKALSLYKNSVERAGKKLYASDSRILEAARCRIESEFAFVLGIERDGVVDHILSNITVPSAIEGMPA